ncbi:DUF2913 family protein [Salmonella enterica subsp. enterica serovar Braenderup str. CFSAN001755]|nr:DUF2913 family protein [Salmonella enterica subsp. enterica serovar Braenderup]
MPAKPAADKAAHLAWCALVALQLARDDGNVNTEAQENIFLARWFAEAMRQKRFCKALAPDIGWLLRQGRELGVRAKLRNKLEYIWHSGTEALTGQSDLFRLTYCLETAKENGWRYQLLSDREWNGRYALKLNMNVSGIYILKSGLQNSFNEDGTQISPVPVKIYGDIDALNATLSQCGWTVVTFSDNHALLAMTG